MIKVVLIDLNALFTFDPNERVQAFLRVSPPETDEAWVALGRIIGTHHTRVLQRQFDYGRVTAAEFKLSLEGLLHVAPLPEADFWSAHCAGFIPDRAAIQSCHKVKESHPLIKFVAIGRVDRKVFGHLLELCGDLEFDDSAVSFMEGGDMTMESRKILLSALGAEERECLIVDSMDKARNLDTALSV